MITIWTVLKIWFAWVVLAPVVAILTIFGIAVSYSAVQELFRKKHK
jgi:hypothetical protein